MTRFYSSPPIEWSLCSAAISALVRRAVQQISAAQPESVTLFDSYPVELTIVQWSQWTVLDFMFILIILVSTAFALTKGLAREIISLVSLVGGFLLASFFYSIPAVWVRDFTRTDEVAHLFGFLIIFLGSLLIGAVVALLVNRFVKMASLEWIDRLLGGIFGFVRGWVVSSIIVLALIAFPVRSNIVAQSYLAPYLLAGARAAVLAVPQELKDRFHEEYRKVLQAWNQDRKSI